MHWFNIATAFLVCTLVGVEFSVSAFINPAAWQLDPEPQNKLLARTAQVLGTVMPIWYPICGVLLLAQTWLHWKAPGVNALMAADAIWILVSVATLIFLLPLNTRVAQGAPDWQTTHHTWDERHRIRIVCLAAAATLLLWVITA